LQQKGSFANAKVLLHLPIKKSFGASKSQVKAMIYWGQFSYPLFTPPRVNFIHGIQPDMIRLYFEKYEFFVQITRFK
jgi:hypothetical protein